MLGVSHVLPFHTITCKGVVASCTHTMKSFIHPSIHISIHPLIHSSILYLSWSGQDRSEAYSGTLARGRNTPSMGYQSSARHNAHIFIHSFTPGAVSCSQSKCWFWGGGRTPEYLKETYLDSQRMLYRFLQLTVKS